MIESTDSLQHWLEQHALPAEVVALDTEADSLHRYRESLCLIQFAASGECVLIDPLAIEDLSPLGALLAQRIVWMHGADYDMTMLKRQFGGLPPVVFDTQIGARLLGARKFGLADLVLSYFGVELSKSSQKADWGKRPLSEKMMEYALNDVHYLLPMAEKITTALRKKDRYEWFVQSCEAARVKVLEREESREDAWRIQGSGRLEPLGLAYLKALWHWRDAEAEQWDRPSFMVGANKVLLEWAVTLAEGGKVALPNHYRVDRVKRFREMVDGVKALDASLWPDKLRAQRRRRDSSFEKKVDALIAARDKAAARHDIDGSLIAARAVLESIAGGDGSVEELLLPWQRECLGLNGA